MLAQITHEGMTSLGEAIVSTMGSYHFSMDAVCRTPEVMDGCLLDSEIGELQIVGRNTGVGNVADISRDGTYAILYRLEDRSDDNLSLIELASGRENLLTPHDGPGSFSAGHFSPDERTIYLSSNQNREFVSFARVQLSADHQPGPIEILAARDDAELQDFAMNEEGTLAALLWNAAGRNELAFLNLSTHEMTPGPHLPGELVFDLTWSKDGRLLAMSMTGSTRPLDIWVLEVTTGQLRQVTHSPHAGIELDTLVQPELVTFPAHDGLQLSAWLYRPRDLAAPYPIVLSFHCGPEGQARPFFQSDYQTLIAQGIAILAPNVRGSSGFGKTFVNLDNGPLRFNAVKDIKACVEYVLDTGIASAERIGIMFPISSPGEFEAVRLIASKIENAEICAISAHAFRGH